MIDLIFPVFFSIPSCFSRFHKPFDYGFEAEKAYNMSLMLGTRESRALRSRSIRFSDMSSVPDSPLDVVLESNVTDDILNAIEVLNEKFRERPVWPRIALMVESKLPNWIIREALHHVAYTFPDGPWVRAWVRYGYDPRIDPSAKIYQIVNYRFNLPGWANVKHSVPAYYRQRHPDNYASIGWKDDDTNFYNELRYKFKENALPLSNTLFYQLIDIELEAVQNIVQANDGCEPDVCDLEDGWLVPNYQDKCRKAMQIAHNKIIDQLELVMGGIEDADDEDLATDEEDDDDDDLD